MAGPIALRKSAMRNDVTVGMLEALVAELEATAPSPAVPASPPNTVAAVTLTTSPETDQERGKLLGALAVISPDVPRGNGQMFGPDGQLETSYWLGVVWAIRSLGWQSGETIARDWSRTSGRYTDEGFDAAWRGFDPTHPRPVGIGSLYKLAKALGGNPDPITVEPATTPPTLRYTLLSSEEIRALPPIEWRVKGVLPARGLAALFGPSGSGKSFLVLDLCAAVAEGQAWFSRRVSQAPVVYVLLEGEAGLRNRVAAWEASKGRPLPAEFGVIVQPFHLTSPGELAALAEAIPQGALVVIDTLNRAAPTCDENSSREMGEILEAAKRLQAMCHGLVLLVHHTGKDTTRGLRGHSSLHAALDAAIEVERTLSGRCWSVAKSKDGEDGSKVDFELKQHVLGLDAEGDEITSCTIGPATQKLFTPKEPTGKAQKAALKVLQRDIQASQDCGKAQAGANIHCLTVEAAITAIKSTLATYSTDKRNNRARTLLDGLVGGGHLVSGIEGDEGWLWLP